MNQLKNNFSFSKKIISGIFTASISLIFVILYPVIASKIGLEQFGLWAILNIIFSAGYLIDFGVIHSSVRLLSKKYHNPDKVKKIIFNSSVIMIINILIVSSILILFKNNIINITGIDRFENHLILFSSSIILMGIISLQNFLRQTVTGIGEFIKSNFLFSICEILRIFLILIYINELSVYKLILFQIISFSILIILYFLFLLQKKLIKPFKISKDIFIEIFDFSKYMAGIKFFNLGFIPVVKIIISNLFGIIYLGIFELSFRIVNFAVGIFANIIFFMFPKISSEENNLSFLKKYLKKVQQIAIIGIPFFLIILFLIIYFKDPIAIYITKAVNDIFIYSLIGGLTYLFIEIIDQPLRIFLLGTNRPKLVLSMLTIQALTTFSFFIFFNNEYLYLISGLITGLLFSKIIYLKILSQS